MSEPITPDPDCLQLEAHTYEGCTRAEQAMCLLLLRDLGAVQVTSTMEGAGCRKPCSVCLCPVEKLSDPADRSPYRTEAGMRTLYESLQEHKGAGRQSVCQSASIHPISVPPSYTCSPTLECAVWQWQTTF